MRYAGHVVHRAASVGLIVCHVLYFFGAHFAVVIAVLWTLEEVASLVAKET